jgi:hypothetical protein
VGAAALCAALVSGRDLCNDFAVKMAISPKRESRLRPSAIGFLHADALAIRDENNFGIDQCRRYGINLLKWRDRCNKRSSSSCKSRGDKGSYKTEDAVCVSKNPQSDRNPQSGDDALLDAS